MQPVPKIFNGILPLSQQTRIVKRDTLFKNMNVLIRHADKINALDHQKAEMMKKYKPFREKLDAEFKDLVSVGLNVPRQLRLSRT